MKFHLSQSSTQNLVQCNKALLAENARLKEFIAAQQALPTDDERYELITSAFNDGIWDWNLLTNNVYLSPRWKEMLGYDRDELPNSFATWETLIHPDDVEYALKMVTTFLASEATFYESIHRLKHKSGTWIWILDRGIVVRDQTKKPIRFFGSHTDITKLRQLEETLLQRERELNNIVTVCPDGIVTFTHENKVSSANPSFLEMTDFTLEELLFISKIQFDEKMIAISDHEQPYHAEIKGEVSALIQIPIIEKREQHRRRRTDDGFSFVIKKPRYRVLRLTICHLEDTAILTVMYFRNVTMEMETNRIRSEFLSVAAHELRTPISNIYGYSELLLHRDFDKIVQNEILQTIHDQSKDLVELINDLLDLARMEARNKEFFHFEFQSLMKIVEQTLSSFKFYDNRRKIEVSYITEPTLIYADVDQVKRAFLNLLSNALKYSSNDKNVTLSFQQRVKPRGVTEIGVTVEDQGIGMSDEHILHIFDRFWRADNVKHIEGTGLGMALVKEIMDLHQGDIEIHSHLGEGTKITLWFPITHEIRENVAYV